MTEQKRGVTSLFPQLSRHYIESFDNQGVSGSRASECYPGRQAIEYMSQPCSTFHV